MDCQQRPLSPCAFLGVALFASETWLEHTRRQNRYLLDRIAKWGIKRMGERVLERIFARGFRCVRDDPLANGQNPVRDALCWLDELSWRFQQALGSMVDPRSVEHRWRHPRPGRAAMWEDSFVHVFGVEWKADLAGALVAGRKDLRQSFVVGCASLFEVGVPSESAPRGKSISHPILRSDIDAGIDPGDSMAWMHGSVDRFEIVGDSELVVGWLNGDYAIRDGNVRELLRPAMVEIHSLLITRTATFRAASASLARHVYGR